MKRISILFLQTVIVLIGISTLVFMLWEPHIEGRNAHATIYMIYFNDQFLAYAYIASIPFFTVLYQIFRVLGHVRQNRIITHETIKALRTIKYCAIALIGFIWGGVIFIMLGSSDDRPPVFIIGILFTFASVIIAAAAAKIERILQNTSDIKS